MLFSAENPMDDLLALLRAKNPAVTQPADAFTVTSVATATNGRNTTITLRANIEYGIKGAFTVALDRTDLSELYNKFPTGQKYPIYKKFGGAGVAVTVSSIIDQINQMLGTKLTMTGPLQDLKDAQFLMPAKDSDIQVSIQSHESSLRLVPGTTLDIVIRSSGAILTNSFVNRSLNPIVNTSGLIPYTGINVNPASPKKHPGYALKFLDFSAAMAGRNYASVVSHTMNTADRCNDLWLNTDLRTQVNTKLAANGLPQLVTTSLGQTDSTSNGNLWYWNTYMYKRTANYASNPLVNSDDFEFFLILPKASLKQADSANTYATDYFMHYNV